MNGDERFERDLHDVIMRDVPTAAPSELRADVARIHASMPRFSTRAGLFATGPRAAAGVAAAMVVVLVGGLLLSRSSVGPGASPSPARSPLGSPSLIANSSAPPTSLAPTSTPTAAPSPVVIQIDQFGLTDATHGWVMSAGRLYLTADNGRTWMFGLDLGDSRAAPVVDFVDGQHGWLADYRAAGGAVIQRTSDGGQSWQKTTIKTAGDAVGLQFFDDKHGVLPFEVNDGKPGSLWSTSDGGATWSRIAPLPVAIVNKVWFSDPETGWALAASQPISPMGRPSPNELYVTRDGGLTWKQSPFPAAPAGWSANDWLPEILASPSVFGPGDAVLSVWYGDGVHGQTQLLVTTDYGASWTVASTLPSLMPVPVDAIDAQYWVASLPYQEGDTSTLNATDDAGKTWHALGDPFGGGIELFEFADRLHGWLWGGGRSGPPGLYATDDGGVTWRALAPSGGPTRTPRPCSASNVLLGSDPSVPTQWFNVFPTDFAPNSTVKLTFSKPVIPYPTQIVDGVPEPSGRITIFTTPVLSTGGDKLSFRAADKGVKSIVVSMVGTGCAASTTVDLTATP